MTLNAGWKETRIYERKKKLGGIVGRKETDGERQGWYERKRV